MKCKKCGDEFDLAAVDKLITAIGDAGVASVTPAIGTLGSMSDVLEEISKCGKCLNEEGALEVLAKGMQMSTNSLLHPEEDGIEIIVLQVGEGCPS